jgi:hypothetical protein
VTSTTTVSGTTTENVAGTISVAAPGIYTVHASATNAAGAGLDSSEITVNLTAPPPTVAISNPTPNASYSYTAGGSGVTVNATFTAVSAYGGINSLTATLDGQPVAVTASGIGQLNASGTSVLQLTGAGSHSFVVTATDQNGTATASTIVNVTIVQAVPPPTVAITQPANGAVFTYNGCSPLSIPYAFTATAGSGSTIASVAASLNGKALTVSTSGLGKASASGTGTLSITAPGTYTLSASAVSGSQSGTATVTFTVNQSGSPQPPPCNFNWLPPFCLGKAPRGGCSVPIQFEVPCSNSQNGNGYWNCWYAPNCPAVAVFVCEVYANGSCSNPQLYTCGWGPNCYTVDTHGNYCLNFPSGYGKHLYQVDVYSFSTNGSCQLIGTKQFATTP